MNKTESATIELYGVTVTITRSMGEDDTPVVFVDTDADQVPERPHGPEIRIRLNDEPVYVGKEYVFIGD